MTLIIDNQLLIYALLALFFPLSLLFRKSDDTYYQLATQDWDDAANWKRVLRIPVHWMDLMRGGMGTWLLNLAIVAGPAEGGGTSSILAKAGILVAATVVHGFFMRGPDQMSNAAFFIIGVMFGVAGLLVGLLTAVISMATVRAMGNWAIFVIALPVAVLGFGFLLGDFSSMYFVVACLPFVPFALSFAMKRELVIRVR